MPIAANQPIDAKAYSKKWKSRTSDRPRRSVDVATISTIVIMILCHCPHRKCGQRNKHQRSREGKLFHFVSSPCLMPRAAVARAQHPARRGYALPMNGPSPKIGGCKIWNYAQVSPFLVQMRMIVRGEECRRRAAECAEKALCSPDQEVSLIFAELTEQWRMLAEHTEYLGQFSIIPSGIS